MQCRWAGCTESTQKGDRKYCKKHRDLFIRQETELMAKMFRCSPQSLIVLVQERKKKVEPANVQPAAPGIPDEVRDQMEREQVKITAELDRKHGYGNGPVNTLSPEQIAEMAPSITPIDLIRGDGRKGRRRKPWNWQRQNEKQKQRKGENEA